MPGSTNSLIGKPSLDKFVKWPAVRLRDAECCLIANGSKLRRRTGSGTLRVAEHQVPPTR
jgi:hypothetical protein